MQDVKRSFRAVSKDRVLKRVCCGPKKPRGQTGYTTSRESSSTPIRSYKGYLCNFKGYIGVQEERGADRGASRKLHGQATLREEVEVY